MAKKPILKHPGANASPEAMAAYRDAVRQMIAGSADVDLAAIPEVMKESDPYIQAQLAALRRMIDESFDPETGKYGKQGVIEFLFNVMNDGSHAVDARMKAANTLIRYFHKSVPTTLMVANQTNLADVDLSSLKPEELDAMQALLDKATLGGVDATAAVLQSQSKH
jgi:hypothetical protein